MRWINSTGFDVQVEMVNSGFENEDFWKTETINLKSNESVYEEEGFALNQDFILVLNNGELTDKEVECREQDTQFGYIVLI